MLGILEPMIAILTLCSSTLKASGDIMNVLITSIVGLWSCRIFLSIVLNYWFSIGLTAVIIGIFIDFTARAIMYLIRVKKGEWKYLRV